MRKRLVIIAVLLVVVSFAAGHQLGLRGYTAAADEFPKVTLSREVSAQTLDFALFWEVWDSIHQRYFDPSRINDAALVFGAIKGMVAAVGDPYTVFLTPEENRVTGEDLSGNFDGVGIQIGFRGSQLAVIAPLPGSPAEQAGVRAGDFIVAIADEQKGIERGTVGISLPEAVQIIRGPAGSTVALTLTREGVDGTITAEVERRSIDVPSVLLNFEGEEENVAHLRLLRFGGSTQKEWDDAVVEILQREGLRGIVLDLRNNPGGFLQGAIDLSADFLETGSTVVIEERSNGQRQEFVTEKIGRLKNRDLVVLVNAGSASASEILAGALRDNISTLILGVNSFGKGTIQDREELERGVGLHVTVAKWLTPAGVWLNEKGIIPDVTIEDDAQTPEDEQFEAAIEQII